jgi:hypothetical protein
MINWQPLLLQLIINYYYLIIMAKNIVKNGQYILMTQLFN